MMLVVALVIAFSVYFIEMALYKRFWKKGLSVRLLFMQKGVNVGESCTLEETICNEKRMPLPVLEVKFATSSSFLFADVKNSSVTDKFYRKDIFSMQDYQKVTRTLEFTATKRGYYSIKELDVLSRDFLFAQDYAMKMENDTALYVYPKKLDTRVLNPFFSRLMGDIVAKQRVEEDLFAFRGLREYRPTDSMRRINWKNTAHAGKMLVNLFETTTTVDVCMLVDGNIKMPFDEEALREEIISLASSVSGDLIRSGISVNVRLNLEDIVTKEPVTIKMSAGRNHIEMIDQALSRVGNVSMDLTIEKMLAEEVKQFGNHKCILVIASDITPAFSNTLSTYRKQGIPIYAIMPYTNRNMSKMAEVLSDRSLIFPWKVEV